MEMENLVKNPERAQDEIQLVPTQVQSVADLKRSIAFYQKQLNEIDFDKSDKDRDNLKTFFELSIIIKEAELVDAEAIEYFKGNIRKAVKLMKQLHDADEDDISDEEYLKIKDKIYHYLGKEELKIKLQIKALEQKLYAVGRVESITRFDNANMWFYKIKDYVKEKKEQ